MGTDAFVTDPAKPEKSEFPHQNSDVPLPKSLLLAECWNNVDESSVVLHTSLGTAGLSLLFLFSINLWGLTLDLTSTSQRTVDFTTKKSGLGADGGVWSNTNLFQSETSLDWGGENFTGWNHVQKFIGSFDIDDGFVESNLHDAIFGRLSVRQSKSDSKMG